MLNIPSPSPIVLTHDFGGLHSIHLLRPSRRGLELPDRPDLVQAVSRHTNIVITFQNDLYIADIEGRVGANLGEAASRGDDIVDKVIGELQHGLVIVLVQYSNEKMR